jgi:hypothetical protein
MQDDFMAMDRELQSGLQGKITCVFHTNYFFKGHRAHVDFRQLLLFKGVSTAYFFLN